MSANVNTDKSFLGYDGPFNRYTIQTNNQTKNALKLENTKTLQIYKVFMVQCNETAQLSEHSHIPTGGAILRCTASLEEPFVIDSLTHS